MTKTRRIDDGRLHDNELHEVLGHLEDASLEQIGWLMREGHLTDPAGQPTGSHPIDDLPLVGDADPDAIHDTTHPVWTWDETHALVGAPDRLDIVPVDPHAKPVPVGETPRSRP